MYSSIIENLKKVLSGITPIIILVLILSFFFKIDTSTVVRFICSSILVIIGLTLFTTGADISLNTIGEKISKSLIKKKNLTLILISCLLLGTFITMLEPEFLTVSDEANGIPLPVLLFSVSLGIGICLMFAIYRMFKKIEFRVILIIGYLIVFVTLMLVNMDIIPFAFDMSSVTTGAISAPFILALGVGFSSRIKKRKNNDSSEFGILSICSIGPILMILILGILFHPNIVYDSDPILKKLNFGETLWMNFYQVFFSMSPLVIMYFIFNHVSRRKDKNLRGIITGLLMVLIGITLFLTGGDVGFFKIGFMLGSHLGNINHLLIMVIGGVFGYFISKIEPSLKVLINYVNEVTNGSIKDRFLEICLCIGVSLSVIMSLFRVLNGYSVMAFLIPTYFIAVLLAFFTPNNFLAIAFDSAGVVAGNMTSSFLLPMLVGVASTIGPNYLKEAFGVLSLVSIIPVIIIEMVGLIYSQEEKKINTNNLDDTIIEYR